MLGPSTGFPRCFKSCEDGSPPILCLLCSAGSCLTWKITGIGAWTLLSSVASATDSRRVSMPSKNYLHLARYPSEYVRSAALRNDAVEHSSDSSAGKTGIDFEG
jgi:hypothetical protein